MSCNIGINERSENVKQLQMFLHEVGLYTCCSVDGIYGKYTKESVRIYQKRHGLVQDGWAGCITTGHMELECANHNCNVSPKPIPPVQQGAEYIMPSKNCQSNDQRIIDQVMLVAGSKSMYDQAVNIFNYVRDAVDYEFYYNTRYGAIGTLLNKKGNCTDIAHLFIAMCRVCKIPARYWNLKARFSSGTYGHVVAEVYVNGKWFVADASNDNNIFGQVRWTLIADYGRSSSINF